PWNDAEAAAQLDALQAERVPLELMLGAMDGRVLGAHLGADINPAGTPPEVATPLGAYYASTAPVEGPHVSTRFASFVAAALPVIPHTGEGTAVALGTDAVEVIHAHVVSAAAFLAFQGWRDAGFGAAVGAPPVPAPPSLERAAALVEAHGAALDTIVSAFVGLLQAGLDGETTFDWPRAT
ncbi:MAG TPA: hypothetical protein VM759_11880, partial [Longimicrobium sp.]|nr:hypothetical protein [Longimicrobium sp.]